MGKLLQYIDWIYQNYPELFITGVLLIGLLFVFLIVIFVKRRIYRKVRKSSYSEEQESKIGIGNANTNSSSVPSRIQQRVEAEEEVHKDQIGFGKFKSIAHEKNEASPAKKKQVLKPAAKEEQKYSVKTSAEKLNEPKAVYQPAKKRTDVKFKAATSRRKKGEPILNKAIKPNSVQFRDFLKVSYSAPNDIRTSFPLAIFPKKGTVVRSHRYGTSKRRGYTEVEFQLAIEQEFGSLYEVSGEVRLNTGSETRPFESDIALINDSKQNPIRIDIEVDEPYAGISRRATHCIGDDVHRDAYFKDRGWIVLRFTEKQVHQKLNYCLAFIAAILKRLDEDYTVPDHLSYNLNEMREQQWDLVQAQAWEVGNYRENYLNHEFQVIAEEPDIVDRDFHEQEIAEERLVEPSLIGKEEDNQVEGYNAKNFFARDARIKFYPDPHIYTVDGVPFTAASNLIANYFPKFDAFGKAANLSERNPLYGLPIEEIVRRWEAKGKASADEGTFLHRQIENYYLGKSYETPDEFQYFEDFQRDHSYLVPYRSEWRIFDEELQVAGTIDFILKDGESFDIYDWKRTRKVVDYAGNPITDDGWGNYGIGPLASFNDTSYNRYCVQQTIYKHILEKNYGIKVGKMYLVILHPVYDQYFKVEALDQMLVLREMIKDL